MQNTDAGWVSEVLENNYAEIKMAQQAQEKATNSEVKSLAQTLEKDHNALVSEAKDLASRKNWTVATQETADARDKMEDMADDDVKEYEKDWLEMMEDKHEKSIRKFENANVDDADLKTWTTNTLPKLQAHLDRINQVQKNRK
jgi:putative membrane protein